MRLTFQLATVAMLVAGMARSNEAADKPTKLPDQYAQAVLHVEGMI